MPAVARKKGMDEHYTRVDGTPQPKKKSMEHQPVRRSLPALRLISHTLLFLLPRHREPLDSTTLNTARVNPGSQEQTVSDDGLKKRTQMTSRWTSSMSIHIKKSHIQKMNHHNRHHQKTKNKHHRRLSPSHRYRDEKREIGYGDRCSLHLRLRRSHITSTLATVMVRVRARLQTWRSMRHRWRWTRGGRRGVEGRMWRRRRERGVASVWLCEHRLVPVSWCLCYWSCSFMASLCPSLFVLRSRFCSQSDGWFVGVFILYASLCTSY